MNTTINISLPKSMYEDARSEVKRARYASISEFIRHALRSALYPSGLTVNGFTPEFEDVVLEAAKEPIGKAKVWSSDKDIDAYFKRLAAKAKK